MVVCKTNSVDPELLKTVKSELSEYMKKSVIGLSSLCFLDYNGEADSVPTDKPEVIYGNSFYQERIFDHVFQVSPTAFLQIHLDMC
jgi:hypothetical protein